jgi:hypothetical protein
VSGHTHPTVPASIASPFSDDTIDLMQKYGALSVTIQVRNIASQSFPLQLEYYNSNRNILPLGFDQEDLNEDDVFGLPLTGPSGVSVRVRFLDKSTERDLEQSFLDLLRELVARRFILAPLATIDKRRLHRHVHSMRVKVKASSSTSDESLLDVMEMTTILPMEGSPFSAEGLKAFTSILSPCGTMY